MPDSPPPYGFRKDIFTDSDQGHSYFPPQNLPPQYISGQSLSYPMPMPVPQPDMNQFTKEILNEDPSEPEPEPEPEHSYIKDYSDYISLGYIWQFLTPADQFPYEKAVRAGLDEDGSKIFVGRSFHEGDMLPAKVIPEKGFAFVSYDGEEHEKTEFEILRTGDFCWEFAKNGEVPEGALAIGQTRDGEKLYMGRCLHAGTQTPGKIQPSHSCLYIPFAGEEIAYSEYEVLVVK